MIYDWFEMRMHRLLCPAQSMTVYRKPQPQPVWVSSVHSARFPMKRLLRFNIEDIERIPEIKTGKSLWF
jgi:hypothetical protein